jgi:hypothetical protein
MITGSVRVLLLPAISLFLHATPRHATPSSSARTARRERLYALRHCHRLAGGDGFLGLCAVVHQFDQPVGIGFGALAGGFIVSRVAMLVRVPSSLVVRLGGALKQRSRAVKYMGYRRWMSSAQIIPMAASRHELCAGADPLTLTTSSPADP